MLQGVYGDYPHHNDGSHLDGGFTDDAIWQRCWHRLATQFSSWYATSSGTVWRRFMAILAAEWHGVLRWNWNSERTLIFSHVVLTKTLGVRRAREIQAWITRQMDLWDRVLYARLVGDAEAEGAASEGRAAIRGD